MTPQSIMRCGGTIVRAVDTNILARYLLDDDPVQSPRARDVMAAGVFIPLTVFLELGWLLGSRFAQPRQTVVTVLRLILDLPGVEMDRPDRVAWAVDRFAAGADLADMIHIVASSSATSFVTFDDGIADKVRHDTPLPIETLG